MERLWNAQAFYSASPGLALAATLHGLLGGLLYGATSFIGFNAVLGEQSPTDDVAQQVRRLAPGFGLG